MQYTCFTIIYPDSTNFRKQSRLRIRIYECNKLNIYESRKLIGWKTRCITFNRKNYWDWLHSKNSPNWILSDGQDYCTINIFKSKKRFFKYYKYWVSEKLWLKSRGFLIFQLPNLRKLMIINGLSKILLKNVLIKCSKFTNPIMKTQKMQRDGLVVSQTIQKKKIR